MLDRKVKYDYEQALQGPDFSRINSMVMQIWRKAPEGSELWNLASELMEVIDQERAKHDDIRATLFMLANKL